MSLVLTPALATGLSSIGAITLKCPFSTMNSTPSPTRCRYGTCAVAEDRPSYAPHLPLPHRSADAPNYVVWSRIRALQSRSPGTASEFGYRWWPTGSDFPFCMSCSRRVASHGRCLHTRAGPERQAAWNVGLPLANRTLSLELALTCCSYYALTHSGDVSLSAHAPMYGLGTSLHCNLRRDVCLLIPEPHFCPCAHH